MKLNQKLLALATLMVSLMPMMAKAQTTNVPKIVNFQAVLRDDNGDIVSDGLIDLQLKILNQANTVVYEETQPGIQVVRGAINVMIGEGIEPGSDPAKPTGGIPLDTLDPEKGDHFLQIQFGSNQPSDPLQLGSVPYAMYAGYAGVALGLSPTIAESGVPPVFVSEGELVTYSANSDAKYVDVAGDTMTGNLTLNGGNIIMAGSETVDGVDVSALSSTVSGHTTAINSLNTTVSNHTTSINSLNVSVSDHETRLNSLEAGQTVTCSKSIYSSTIDGSTADVVSDVCECRIYGLAIDFGSGATAMSGLASVVNIQDDGVSEKEDQNYVIAVQDDTPSKMLFLLAHSCDNNPAIGGLAIGLVPGTSCPTPLEQFSVTPTLITNKGVQLKGDCVVKSPDIAQARSNL